MEAKWRVRIQFYSLALILIYVATVIYKYHWHHWAVPLIAGALMVLIFGGYMHNMEKLINEDGTFKTDKDIEEEAHD